MKIQEKTRFTYQYHAKMESHARKYSRNALFRDKPVLHEIFLSLEEISRGVTKKMKIATKVFNEDYTIARTDQRVVKMIVPPGSRDGTQIVIPSAGDKKPGLDPADVIFVIRERQHPSFVRDGENNLIFKADITLREALTGCDIDIPLLNGESLKLSTQDVVSHGTRKRISGKGLPRYGESPGDLLVDFSVQFPVQLNKAQKEKISTILPD